MTSEEQGLLDLLEACVSVVDKRIESYGRLMKLQDMPPASIELLKVRLDELCAVRGEILQLRVLT